jgi:hypothetical protein
LPSLSDLSGTLLSGSSPYKDINLTGLHPYDFIHL